MKITEILIESQQVDEGPMAALGRGVGAVARGAGAVAGGIAGIGRAVKKGYASGKATVAGDPDPYANDFKKQPTAQAAAPADDADATAAPAPAAKPAAPQAPAQKQTLANPKTAAPAAAEPSAPAAQEPAAQEPAAQPTATTPPSAQAINKAGPKGTVAAKAQTGQAGKALAKTTDVMAQQGADKAGQTMYAQVKANVDKLDKKGKQRILQLLQKSLAQTPAAPAAAPAAPAAAPAAPMAKRGKPVTVSGKPAAPAAKPAAVNAGLERTGSAIKESFSFFRK